MGTTIHECGDVIDFNAAEWKRHSCDKECLLNLLNRLTCRLLQPSNIIEARVGRAVMKLLTALLAFVISIDYILWPNAAIGAEKGERGRW